ncbi:DJ-1 family protein [Spirochaetia bacterium]|nr:DJ-1 family protein [Spirochaetia bacterium]GHU32852.1 DJ-1 family protein [Spirochaetia bacterium]
MKALIFLAEGFEEVEALTPVDFLRRAGIEVTMCAVGSERTVTGSHRIPVTADVTIESLPDQQWDAVLLPGGMPGSKHLAESEPVQKMVVEMADSGKIVAAICAAPALVLGPLGVLKGRKFTCYPGMEQKVSGSIWTQDRVAVDANIITSRGAGTAGLWSCAIIAALAGESAAQDIAKSVVM